MRIYTCTPVDFEGDAGFFARDSGLFSCGLRALGFESMAIMPGPSRPNDLADKLIRTTLENLHDAKWWSSIELDGLIFYSWASPAYTEIAKAINAAGIPFVVVMDTSGVISPLACPMDWLRSAIQCRLLEKSGFFGKIKAIVSISAEALFQRTARRRLAHYNAATAIAVVTPHAALWVKNEIMALSPESDLDKRVHYLPHPQLEHYNYDNTAKENTILSVARWTPEDWPQKNPSLLLKAIDLFLNQRHDWSFTLIGKGAANLLEMLPDIVSKQNRIRIHLIDHVLPDELAVHYRKAKIAAWSSRWEGQQGTAAQALCCGCSVVAPDVAEMSCFRHYVSRESGRLAAHPHPVTLAEEFLLESYAWDQGQRDPTRIAGIWQEEFHAPKVAMRALQILGLQLPPSGSERT